MNPFDFLPNNGEEQKEQVWSFIKKHPFIAGGVLVVSALTYLGFAFIYPSFSKPSMNSFSPQQTSIPGSQTTLYAIGNGPAITVLPSADASQNRPTTFSNFTLFAPQADVGISANSRVDVDRMEIISGGNGITTGDDSPVNATDTLIWAGQQGIKTGNNSPVTTNQE